MKGVRLSLCMIVKDEEDCIARCLESVKDIVDEIIIVDTGSTDHTIEICKSFGAKITTFPWNGSFADARNHGIKEASGDWILWLDADEELDKEDKWKLRNGTHFEDYDAINLHLINYYGKHVDENNSTDIAHTRLFRNNGIKFINKMHECLELGKIPPGRIGYMDISVRHYGYLDSVMKKKGKSDRNIRMLEQMIKDGENVFWAHYYIAMDHYQKKQHQKALERVNLSILAFLQEKVLPPSMVYKLKYSILIAMGRFKEALPGIDKALLLYPDYVDLHFFKGMILFHLKNYAEAVRCFEKCLELGEGNKNHLILKGVGSFQAWHYIGRCQQKLGQKEAAAVSLLNSLLLAPAYEPALKDLRSLKRDKKIAWDPIIERSFHANDLQQVKEILNKR